jgi:hypothetical protein
MGIRRQKTDNPSFDAQGEETKRERQVRGDLFD